MLTWGSVGQISSAVVERGVVGQADDLTLVQRIAAHFVDRWLEPGSCELWVYFEFITNINRTTKAKLLRVVEINDATLAALAQGDYSSVIFTAFNAPRSSELLKRILAALAK